MEGAIVIVQNSEGEIYTHKRSPNKKKFPNLYGLGSGGHVEQGETNENAAKRELKEELGIESNIKYLFDIQYENMILHIFYTKYDGEIEPCNREFSWSGWLSIKEIDKLAKENQLSPDTKIFYEKFKKMNIR